MEQEGRAKETGRGTMLVRDVHRLLGRTLNPGALVTIMGLQRLLGTLKVNLG